MFELGQVLATPGVLEAAAKAGDNLAEFIGRHAAGDWGTVDKHDSRANDRALKEGGRLLSVTCSRTGPRYGSLQRPTARRRRCCCQKNTDLPGELCYHRRSCGVS